MSLSPFSVSAAAISVPLRSFSGSVSVVLRSPATICAAPQGRSLSAATTLSNVIGFQMATGSQRWYIIGCYLAPNDISTIYSVVAALKERTQGAAMLVGGDLNTTLTEPENDRRGTDIPAALTEERLEDIATHFLLRQRKWGRERRTWSMVREGKVVRSRRDYILGTYHRLFWNVSVRDPWHNTDHYIVLGYLCSAKKREHTK